MDKNETKKKPNVDHDIFDKMEEIKSSISTVKEELNKLTERVDKLEKRERKFV